MLEHPALKTLKSSISQSELININSNLIVKL